MPKKEKETGETTDDRQPWSHHAAPLGRLDRHAGRHEQTYESRVRAGRHPYQEGGAASPAATNPIPLPRASLSFLVKQPGGLGYKLHSKCSRRTYRQDL